MILTCPECATSYFVDDSRIPAAGRTVQCTNCGARWKALPEGAAPAPSAPEPSAAAPAESAAAAAVEGSPPDRDEVVAAEPEPLAPPRPTQDPFRRAALRPSVSERRQGRAKAFGWAAAAAVVVALVAGAILFRGQVVRLWPKSRAAYAGLGLPVQGLGLVIEAVRVEPAFEGGRPVLAVTGSIRNVKDEAVEAPPLRINLLDRAGKPIAAKVARPLDGRIPARAQRHFAIAIADPPANAQDLELSFEGGPAQRASAVGAAPPPLPPVTPMEAQPLPASAPEALGEHG